MFLAKGYSLVKDQEDGVNYVLSPNALFRGFCRGVFEKKIKKIKKRTAVMTVLRKSLDFTIVFF